MPPRYYPFLGMESNRVAAKWGCIGRFYEGAGVSLAFFTSATSLCIGFGIPRGKALASL